MLKILVPHPLMPSVALAAFLTMGAGCGTTSPTRIQSAPSMTEQVPMEKTPYYEMEHDGRIYVIGDDDMAASFKEHHHLPYTRTLVGEGPKGETVVIQVDKDNPELASKLEAQFRKRHSL